MDVALVKKRLSIKTAQHDDYLNEIVPDVIAFTKDYCNNQFLDENNAVVLPPGVKLFIPKACEYLLNKAGVTNRKMDTVSYTYDMDFPPGLIKLIRPYKRVRFR